MANARSNCQRLMVLIISKANDPYWVGAANNFADAAITDTPNWVVASVQIMSYAVLDHQFIQTQLALRNEKGQANVSMLIPRSLVATIIETKTGFDVAGFGKMPAEKMK